MRKVIRRLSLLMLPIFLMALAGSATISAAALPARKVVSPALLTTPPPPVPQPMPPATATPRLAAFPTVSPGGTPITSDYTYFHTTGLFSVPHFVSFDCSSDTEEVVDHETDEKGANVSRVGTTFSSCEHSSVLHIFVDRNNDAPVTQLNELAAVNDKEQLDYDWSKYNGGYTELDRIITSTRYILLFELVHNGRHYLARQATELAGNGWTKTVRVIVPENNPGLLDNLEAKIWADFKFYNSPPLFSAPLGWYATVDTDAGYIIRYPDTWSEVDAEPGEYASIYGTLDATPLTLDILVEADKRVADEADARAWVAALHPESTIRAVQADANDSVNRWLVSYNDPDSPYSAVVVLINGKNGSLYSADYVLELSDVDLLDGSEWLTTLSMSWDTFTFLNAQTPISTATPQP